MVRKIKNIIAIILIMGICTNSIMIFADETDQASKDDNVAVQLATEEPEATESVATEEPEETEPMTTEEPEETESAATEEPEETEPGTTEEPKATEPAITEAPKPTEPVTTEEPTDDEEPLIGDVNNDLKVNSIDALHILKHAAKITLIEKIDTADVNGDGSITSKDALEVLYIVAKVDKNKPVVTLSGKVRVSDVNGTAGTFKVIVYDITAPHGVKTVQIPVWSKNDQSDIKWYNATKQPDGTYSVIVKVSDFEHYFGKYNIHVYITMYNDVRGYVAKTTQKISPLNYLKVEKINQGSVRLTLMFAGNGLVNAVYFPTWSKDNGQDDVIWHNASYAGDGNWSAVIDIGEHKGNGDFISHAYVEYNGTQTGVSTAEYTLTANDFSELIGSFSTVSQNNANGTYNMSKALLVFNNVVLYPGDTISFFAQAGPCGYADGYKIAGTVQGTGYGGGICQASTTLYGAALRSGMTIIERRSHSSRSVYVPIGQDAMVSYGSSDLKFRNDLNRPVKIVTYVIGKTLYAEIWGIQPSWFDDIQINSWATGANSAAAERIYYKDGVIVKRERLTNSYYPKG